MKGERMLPDKRLDKRLEQVVEHMSAAPQRSIPQLSENRAEMKAIYRFLG